MQPDRGFTLIEVLVAFIIAVGALAVLTRAGVDGVRNVTVAGRYQEAMARAQSHLAAIGDAPTPSDRQGDEGGGFHWHVRIAPIGSEAVAGAQPGLAQSVSLLAVSVAISWGDGPRRVVELDSERLAPGKAGPAP